MKPFPVPVVGPGSQAQGDEELAILALPREMATFAMPGVPKVTDAQALRAARDLLQAFHRAFAASTLPEGAMPRLDLTGVPPAVLAIVDEMLGEGEVAIQIAGARQHRIQETVFAGMWRVVALDGAGRLVADWLEAAPVPSVALAAAREAATERLIPVELPPGAMNSPALLAELGAQLAQRERSASAHVVNLTLLPLSPEDHQVLERALPIGPVAIMSRGFGNCRITSTLARDVWRVQYFNSMSTLILNTIEVVDVPEVALAADEDLADSRARLAELIAWMDDSIAAA